MSSLVPENILTIAEERLTPGMKQYKEAKLQHPDCLVMLRMGDFYEMFYEDAMIASKELEITLTARGVGDKRAPLAGIPFHALDSYLGKLIHRGHKVAIVEQLEDPRKAKGLIKRGLVRIVTPGTVIESSLLNEKENNYLLSLFAFGEQFAIAYCDMSTAEFATALLGSEQQLFSHIVRLHPSECLVPESLQVNRQLISKLKQYSFVSCIPDSSFSEQQAKMALREHFGSEEQIGLESNAQQMVCGALLSYLHQTQKNKLSHLTSISIASNKEKMLLDSSTLRNLELVSNIKDGTSRGALLSVLDRTVTAMGSRLMRTWIKEPLLSVSRIKERLQAIEELSNDVIAREELCEHLARINDLERLIGRINYGNATPRDLLALKLSLARLPKIVECCSKTQSRLLTSFGASLVSELREIEQLLERSIVDDPPLSIREGGMIRRAYHAEVDQLHEIKTNGKKYIQAIEEKERKATGISTLKVGFTSVFGYFIEVTKKNIAQVPSSYIRKQTTANSERYITEELKEIEEKILTAEERLQDIEYTLFQDICAQISTKTALIQQAGAYLAQIDVLCSLSRVALEQHYCKPHFVDQGVVHIKQGRHPVVELMTGRFIANDVLLDAGQMMIVTGPNTAGKSTIMRQTALIVLMAQIGSFVPASEATLGIVDRIFTRVGAYDDLSSGQSTFMVEMLETASIVQNATHHSLIIIDEIGRGTSTFDGVSIAWSVAEYIANHIKAKTMFATHYHVLNKLAERFPKVKNYNVAVKEVQGELIFLHRLLEGGTDQSHGIHVAKLAGLPVAVIQRAEEIQAILQKDDEMVRKIKAKRLEEQSDLGKFGGL